MGIALVTQHVINTSQEDQGNAVLATDGETDSSNKIECFSYKSEWENA